MPHPAGGVRLAVVGTRMLACPHDRQRAAQRAALAIRCLTPDVVISGGADGSDEIARQAALAAGYREADGTLLIFRPAVRRFHGPGGYRERDEKIARECTHLLRLACLKATTYGSGWTADRAEQLGATVVRHTVCAPQEGARHD
jgi:hypothetical protein